MEYKFATRFNNLMPNEIRDVMKRAAGPGMISFSAGRPDNEAFPVEEVKKISAEVLEDSSLEILQYLMENTYKPLKTTFKKFLNSKELIFTDNDDLMVTCGSGEALEIASKVFCNDGDTIVAEDPTFVGALNSFISNNAKLIGVPLEDDGMNIELLEKALQTKPTPKLLYIIPTFQNPTCIVTSLEKRKAIYDLCVKYGVMILEDNPYAYINFGDKLLPTIKSIDTEGIVIYTTTASKIVSPGMRLGVVVSDKQVINKFNAVKGTSGGGLANWSQYVINKFFETIDMEAHEKHISAIYKKKSSYMYEMMKKSFHPDVKFDSPKGGMFIWFKMPDYVDCDEFVDEVVQNHIAVATGKAFAVQPEHKNNGIRLSYTSASMEEIKRGIFLIGELTYKYCEERIDNIL